MESHHCYPDCYNASYTIFKRMVNKAFAQSLNTFGYSGVQMVALCCEETGLGHNEIKSADEKCKWKEY